jgi:hypothetical protein
MFTQHSYTHAHNQRHTQIATDYLAGGPHMNPAVSLYLYALGEINGKQLVSRSAAAFAGATVAFPLFDFVAARLKLPQLGGPL